MSMRILGNVDSFELWDTPRNQAFIDALKAGIPPGSRKWGRDEGKMAWIVAAPYLDTVKQLCQQHFGQMPLVTGQISSVVKAGLYSFELHYLGLPKPRGDGSVSSMGWTEGGWKALFELGVLAAWFGFAVPGESGYTGVDQSSHYATLGVSRTADEAAVKSAYRRAARTYHPDVNKEPDAAAAFIAVKKAYDTLSDPGQRARYDMALVYAGSSATQPKARREMGDFSWRPPVRCGRLSVEAAKVMGVYQLKRIVGWQDITNELGQTMVTYWPKGADHFEVRWL